jgi:hypothetical protein
METLGMIMLAAGTLLLILGIFVFKDKPTRHIEH